MKTYIYKGKTKTYHLKNVGVVKFEKGKEYNEKTFLAHSPTFRTENFYVIEEAPAKNAEVIEETKKKKSKE